MLIALLIGCVSKEVTLTGKSVTNGVLTEIEIVCYGNKITNEKRLLVEI